MTPPRPDPARGDGLYDGSDGPISPSQKARLAAEVLATYARVRWLMRREQLPVLVDRLRRGPGAQHPLGDRRVFWNGVRLGAIVGKVLSPLPADSRCLARSLVLTALLARRGIPSSLVIGVRGGPSFAAHAWVEYDGWPLLRDEGRTYRRLVEFRHDGSVDRPGAQLDGVAAARKTAQRPLRRD